VETSDLLAVEEPLEIRIAGEPIAVTMRTPGSDHWLTAGFLLSEGIIGDLGDVSRIYHCGRPGTDEFGNTVDVTPAPGHSFNPDSITSSKRGTLTTSSCGVCGRQNIDDLLDRLEAFSEDIFVSVDLIHQAIGTLNRGQPTFNATGGVHAAAIVTLSGETLSCCEDIGRHNAVDKAVGSLLYRDSWPKDATILSVSGRASFEIVQKAAAARIPVVASVSAASSLATDLADQMGIILAGFVRGDKLNIYTHSKRVT